MTTIILPTWIPLAKLELISKTIDADIRIVGGCVRDILQNKVSSDIDIASGALPDIALAKLTAAGIKAIPTGLKYGTITILMGGDKFELTTLRADVKTYGRHAEVEYITDWQIDALRRDFTINSLSIDLQGNLYDYCHGYEDLQQSIIRFIGEPQQRIVEDGLRMLRFFRFYAYLPAAKADEGGLQAILAYWDKIHNLSGERIRQEMFKLLTAPNNMQALKLMVKHQLLDHLNIINLSIEQLASLAFEHEFLPNLAALMITGRQDDTTVLVQQWRLSNYEANMLKFLLSTQYRFNVDINSINNKEIIYRLGKQKALLLLQMQLVLAALPRSLVKGLEEMIKELAMPHFPIDGHMIKQLGYEGKDIANCLEQLKSQWIASDFKLSPKQLLEKL